MNAVRNAMLAFLSGALLGDLVSSFLSDHFMQWDRNNGDPNAMCNCLVMTKSIVGQMLHIRLIGAFIGAGLVLAIYLWATWALGRRKGPPAVVSPPAAR